MQIQVRRWVRNAASRMSAARESLGSEAVNTTIRWLSGEFLFSWPRHRANGGSLITLRAAFVSLVVGTIVMAIDEALAPTSRLAFDAMELRVAVRREMPSYGAVFAGAYAIFYARFSSQWTYLAGVYNQIKASELRAMENPGPESRKVLAEWKAGFIEDAEDLHLALKPMFGAIIKQWAEQKDIVEAFRVNTPRGSQRLPILLAMIEKSLPRT